MRSCCVSIEFAPHGPECACNQPRQPKLRTVPTTLRAANAFVAEHHRHHKPVGRTPADPEGALGVPLQLRSRRGGGRMTGTEGRVSSPEPEPPKRRFTMTIEAAGDNTAALSRILDNIDHDMWERPDEPRKIVSGGGWSLTVVENPDGLVGDEYDEALSVWWQDMRARRRAAEEASDV